MIRHDTNTMHYIYVRPKADSQLNLPHGTKQKRVTDKKNKNRDAQKKRSSHKVRGVSPEAGRVYGGKDL